MSTDIFSHPAFTELGLIKPVMRALDDAGYETPTPIQAKIIPQIFEGKDVLGQAQTGTGKTAAFALPLLSRIDLSRLEPQVLVLTPTRELAIQVAEAFQQYAAYLRNFHVLPIYGGQEYGGQLRRLKRGVHVIVGTPGRLMDHMRRRTLNLEALCCMIIDEADEMLRMGFLEDVEWILEQLPAERQIGLFSATIPTAIRRIAKKYLQDPVQITIKTRTTTVETTRQRYWMVSGLHKLDALTRILEAEPFDGVIVFVKTKTSTVQLAEKLQARGFAAGAINGDVQQKKRERTIEQLKSGKLNILVATDVAARGLDVDRISHVINYDIPFDTEGYVHRIGRTGRAGRKGEAILFVAPREKRMLNAIEKATNQKIEMMQLPNTEAINNKRIAAFKQKITDTLAVEEIGFYYQLMEQYIQERNVPALEIAAALAKMVQGNKPLLLSNKPSKAVIDEPEDEPRRTRTSSKRSRTEKPEDGMERYRIHVGKIHGVKPANIVGAIANETGLDSDFIGRISIYDDYSTVDLPAAMPREMFRILKKVWVSGQQLMISRFDEPEKNLRSKGKRTSKPKHKKVRDSRTKKRGKK